jgi:transketolase
VELDERDIDGLCIDTIRTLAMDAVEQAASGHPGAPMGLAPVAYTLWQRHLRYDPDVPFWPNRDRFVLSAGHASMLLYALLHLSEVKAVAPGYRILGRPAVSLEDIERFRQLGSACAGHPEYGLTSGVETTTGPLGQGAATSVGMAMAGRWLAERFNRPGFTLFDYRVYALCGDGDIMEGISAEAASLAGHLRLGNLCWIYDNNRITIEGSTALAFSEDVARRFGAYGWAVHRVDDANDLEQLDAAFRAFEQTGERPTLIIVDSHIAWGAPTKQDSAAAHGAPLGEDEVRGAKRFYGWPEDARFLVPDGVRQRFDKGVRARGKALHAAWRELFQRYAEEHPDAARELSTMQHGGLPDGWDEDLPVFPATDRGPATRAASGKVLNALAQRIPWLMGGSADLGPSNKTLLSGEADFQPADHSGRNIHFGIREHAMGAVLNGLALCHLRPYGGTFLVFSDYMRPAIRLASLMRLPVCYVFTHDSICLGEDGPTHQPVEQIASLRAIPDLVVIRPADANEVTEAYRVVLGMTDRPVALVLTRQSVPTLDRTRCRPPLVARGAYVLWESAPSPELILIGTGSEVALCLNAAEVLAERGVAVRVVSMPSWELFELQPPEYREAVLPPAVAARVSVELGVTMGWRRYVGDRGEAIGLDRFGASAPAKVLLEHFGFTVDRVVETAERVLARVRESA